MATKRKDEASKKFVLEVEKIIEWRLFKLQRLQEQSQGTPQQQRLVQLELSRPWDFTPEEEVEFMLTPTLFTARQLEEREAIRAQAA